LASVEPVKEASFYLENIAGAFFLNKQKVKKNVKTKSPFSVSAPQDVEMMIHAPQSRWVLKLTKGSQISFRYEDDVLWADIKKGHAFFNIKESQQVHALELGEWRFGKRSGSFGVSRVGESVTVLNEEVEGFLRKNELIAKVEKIEPQRSLQFSDSDGLVAARDHKKEAPVQKKYQMPQVLMPEAQARSLAAEEFCQAPQGAYESCAWKCFGAGAKESKCGLSKKSQCVRFTCSADKQWKLPTPVTGSECSVDIIRVGACR
jgi:hypothetical protein